MSKYTLSINIQSENKELLENLMVTLETINGNIEHIDSVELLTVSGPSYIDYTNQNASESSDPAGIDKPSITQRNLFLDNWVISEIV